MDDKKPTLPSEDEKGIHYEIKVKGQLEEHWADWLGGLSITHDAHGNSLLTGVVPDQAALHGILAQIRDLGLTLISLTPQDVEKMEDTDENSMETPPEVPNNIHYAGFAKRLTAFAFDYLIICGYIALLIAATLAVFKIAEFMGLSLGWPENPLLADLMAFVTLILPVILYFTLQESSPRQATWGKRKAGIRAVNANGETLTRLQAFVRSLVKFLPWQIAHTSIYHIEGLPFAPVEPSPMVITGFVLVYLLVGIYVASALISKKHRTPYDWASGSYVIVEKG
ncbi:MAG: RDD family protein [Chloroflexi bacterium]|nr:RDD family protein [Chloroflexota bacterium]